MKLSEIRVEYNENNRKSMHNWLTSERIKIYCNNFVMDDDRFLFLEDGFFTILPKRQTGRRQTVSFETFVEIYKRQKREILEERHNKTFRRIHGLPTLTNPVKDNTKEATYDLINYEPLDLINDLKNKYNTVTIIKLKNKSKLNIIKYRRS